MSLEVFGAEESGANYWDETAMRQDFDVICEKFDLWLRTYTNEISDNGLKAAADAVFDVMTALVEDHMSGRIG